MATSEGRHRELASSVNWNCASDIFTCSDDQSVQRWSPQGHNMGKVSNDGGICLAITMCLASNPFNTYILP